MAAGAAQIRTDNIRDQASRLVDKEEQRRFAAAKKEADEARGKAETQFD
jgi:hypothetical protein